MCRKGNESFHQHINFLVINKEHDEVGELQGFWMLKSNFQMKAFNHSVFPHFFRCTFDNELGSAFVDCVNSSFEAQSLLLFSSLHWSNFHCYILILSNSKCSINMISTNRISYTENSPESSFVSYCRIHSDLPTQRWYCILLNQIV